MKSNEDELTRNKLPKLFAMTYDSLLGQAMIEYVKGHSVQNAVELIDPEQEHAANLSLFLLIKYILTSSLARTLVHSARPTASSLTANHPATHRPID